MEGALFLRAVRLTEAHVRDILCHYDLGRVRSVAWLADGFQSENYTLLTDRGKYCLRLIYEQERRVEYVLGLCEVLPDRGIPTARPVPTVEGRLFVLHRGTPAAIQTFVEGISAADDPKPLPVYGQVLGRLHAALAAAGLEGLEGEGKGCLASLRMFAEWFPPDPWVRGQYEALEQDLARLPLSTYTRCVVHGDCGPKDFYFEGDRLVGILDFGAAHPDYVLYDLATMMMFTRIFTQEKRAEYESFVRAYREAFPLPREELHGLHALLRTRLLIQVGYSWRRYRRGEFQGLASPEENLEGIEEDKAMLRLMEEVPKDFYLLSPD